MGIKYNYIILSVSVFALSVLVFFTNPNSLPVYLFILPFLFIFLFFLCLFNILSIKILYSRLDLRGRRKRIVTVSTAFLITLLIALQSIGQLTLRDFITVMILCMILVFYVNKASFAE